MKKHTVRAVGWWFGFLASASLPAWGIGALDNFGGHIWDSMDYGNYRWICGLIFLVAFVLTVRLLWLPDKFMGLRYTAGVCIGAVLLAGSCTPLIGSRCGPETIELGKAHIGAKTAKIATTKGGCDSAVALSSFASHGML